MAERDAAVLSSSDADYTEDSSSEAYTPSSDGQSSTGSDEEDQSRNFRTSWADEATKLARMHELTVPEKPNPAESSPGFAYMPDKRDARCPARDRHSSRRRKRRPKRRKNYCNEEKVDELCGINDELAREAGELESLLSRTQRDREKDLDTVRELEGYTDVLGNRVYRLEEQVRKREEEKRKMSREIAELRKALRDVEASKKTDKKDAAAPPFTIKLLQAKVKNLSKLNEQLQAGISIEKTQRSQLEVKLSQISMDRFCGVPGPLQSHRDEEFCKKLSNEMNEATAELRRCRSASLSADTAKRGLCTNSPTVTETTTTASGQISFRDSGSCSSSDDDRDNRDKPPPMARMRPRPAGVAGLDMAKVMEVRDRDNRRTSAPPVPMSLVDELKETFRSEADSENSNKLPHDPAELEHMFKVCHGSKKAPTTDRSNFSKTFMMLHADGVDVSQEDGDDDKENSGANTKFEVCEFGVDDPNSGNTGFGGKFGSMVFPSAGTRALWMTAISSVSNLASNIPKILLTPRSSTNGNQEDPGRPSNYGQQGAACTTSPIYSPLHSARTARRCVPPQPVAAQWSPCPSPRSGTPPNEQQASKELAITINKSPCLSKQTKRFLSSSSRARTALSSSNCKTPVFSSSGFHVTHKTPSPSPRGRLSTHYYNANSNRFPHHDDTFATRS